MTRLLYLDLYWRNFLELGNSSTCRVRKNIISLQKENILILLAYIIVIFMVGQQEMLRTRLVLKVFVYSSCWVWSTRILVKSISHCSLDWTLSVMIYGIINTQDMCEWAVICYCCDYLYTWIRGCPSLVVNEKAVQYANLIWKLNPQKFERNGRVHNVRFKLIYHCLVQTWGMSVI